VRFPLSWPPRSHAAQLERHDDALADIDASLALAPTSWKAQRTRARLHMHFEKFESAIQDFRAAAEQAEFEGADGDARALKAEVRKAEAALKRSKTKDYYKILGVCFACSRERTGRLTSAQALREMRMIRTSRRRTVASRSYIIQTRFTFFPSTRSTR
jgi:tetratricopeptide (TPR) repeat protein